MKICHSKCFVIVFGVLLIFMNLINSEVQFVNASVMNQAVTITALDANGNRVIDTSVIKFTEGDTAEVLLDELAKENKIKLEYLNYDWGNMLVGINDVRATETTFWAFAVNGISADVGLSDYVVSHGDNILLQLSGINENTIGLSVSVLNEAGNYLLEETAITLIENSTAYDALFQATEGDIDVSIDEKNIIKINNIKNFNKKASHHWELLSDDTPIVVDVLSHNVVADEHVQFKLQTKHDLVDQTSNYIYWIIGVLMIITSIIIYKFYVK